MSVLDRIVDDTRDEVKRRRKAVPLKELEKALERRAEGFRPFSEALTRPGVSLIAEHKRRSPSAGKIRKGSKVAEVVRAYERGGAAALSILTEPFHFGGSLDDLREARANATPADPAQGLHRRQVPALRSRRRGRRRDPADRRRARATRTLGKLLHEATDLDLDALVEVHDERELERALEFEADVLGINNRDLSDFSVDIERTYELLADVPAGKTVVSESGFSTREQLDELERVGVDAVLIGETLMRADDIEAGRARADRRRGAAMTKVKVCGITRLEDAELAIGSAPGRSGSSSGRRPSATSTRRSRRASRAQVRRKVETVGRVRQPADRRDRRPRRHPRPHARAAARRRGPVVLLGGRPAHGREGDQGRPDRPRRRPARPRALPHRLPPARHLQGRASTAAPARPGTGSWSRTGATRSR